MTDFDEPPFFSRRRPVFGRDYDRGWIGFNHSRSWMSRVIEGFGAFTRRSEIVISHVFVTIGDDLCVEAGFGRGVLVKSLEKQYFNDVSRYIVFRRPRDLTPAIADRICELVEAQVGTRFDNGALVAQALPATFLGWASGRLTNPAQAGGAGAPFEDPDRWICSELAAYALQHVPQYAGRGCLARDAGTISPQELFEADELFDPLPQPDGRRLGAREMKAPPIREKESDIPSGSTNN